MQILCDLIKHNERFFILITNYNLFPSYIHCYQISLFLSLCNYFQYKFKLVITILRLFQLESNTDQIDTYLLFNCSPFQTLSFVIHSTKVEQNIVGFRYLTSFDLFSTVAILSVITYSVSDSGRHIGYIYYYVSRYCIHFCETNLSDRFVARLIYNAEIRVLNFKRNLLLRAVKQCTMKIGNMMQHISHTPRLLMK